MKFTWRVVAITLFLLAAAVVLSVTPSQRVYEVELMDDRGEVLRTLVVLKEPSPYYVGWRLTEAKTGATLYWCGSLTFRELKDPTKYAE